MEIICLKEEQEKYINEIAEMLKESFAENWPKAWPTIDSALIEVRESLKVGRISLIALKEEKVVGWIGGISERDGKVWELHPLVVKKDEQGKGIGTALIASFEHEVKQRGGLTIWLGTDDENGMTSVSDKDLYPNLLKNISEIKNLNNHPFEFYKKMGYELAGILPDANGIGKPDIFMAKSVWRRKKDNEGSNR
ncbi:GNAT family N-acetyltransferase [Evansella sp. AB-P1]|uniref:GNAT family N-acetyltransferase n=1 Tax=Evansella sp. AB-P1 TaxID=3037653 RepID=UPI00241CF7B7|nr:GNAT family N-acetyltransferase [Evansella sp. AB-P1]MDG5789690.1 GNAT family N-acetyltransferase [Evansella sp. AB-P1]